MEYPQYNSYIKTVNKFTNILLDFKNLIGIMIFILSWISSKELSISSL